MRRAAKVDVVQREIVAVYRKIGASWVSLAAVGKGVPDLLVGWRGANYLVECKSPKEVRRSAGDGLTRDQIEFISDWKGSVRIATDEKSALAAIGFWKDAREAKT